MNDHARRDPRHILRAPTWWTRLCIAAQDIRYLSRAMRHPDVPASTPEPRPHPGTDRASAIAYLADRGLWRGRADCRHVYRDSLGKTTEINA